jgi:uncharacterized alkaline shock family protein YloU
MSVNTANAYGKITITEEAVAQVAGSTALDCYGVVDLVSKKLSDSMLDLFKKESTSKGVRVLTNGDRIFIDLYVILKYGVSIKAVGDSLKKAVKYNVERFTGMVVDTININVVGIRI